MKRLIPILGVGLLIVLLVFVNRGISHTAQPDDDDDDAPSTAQKTAKPAPTATPAGLSAELPAEITVGDSARAKHRITVGWVYDEASQANPQALSAALQVIQQVAQNSRGAISAEVVDLDTPPADRSPQARGVTGLGISVDGKAVGPAVNPGSPGLTVGTIPMMLPR